MAGFKQEVVDEILMRTDIEDLISGYVSLKRAGSNLKGLCPFHSEKSPSFTVYPATSSFYCFGCGVGGDAVTFVKNIEHLDYPDAIEFLAKRAGISIVRDDSSFAPKNSFKRERIWQMNKDAAGFFHKNLMANNPDSRKALKYFTENRGLSMSTIVHFGLGYAPNDYYMFSRYMISLGYTYDELVAGFLCGKNEKGRYYDAFRNRVMFPIIDVTGNVIAFGGRAMDNETKPKYKNSSDTPVFKKSRNLFALNFARHFCQDIIILCEGYMDVIALHSAGFQNAVATLGTAITDEQARLLGKYSKKILICYDSDEAGQKAADRAIGIINKLGIETGIISLSGSKDPDEYIKKFGRDKFRELIEGAKSRFDFALESILSKHDINIATDKIKALQLAEIEISRYNSVAEREVYSQIVANKFGVSPQSVLADVDKIRQKAEYKKRHDDGEAAKLSLAGYGDKVNPDYAKAPATARCEEFVLSLMLLYPEYRKLVFNDKLISNQDFFTDFGKRLFDYIEMSFNNGDTFTNMNEIFSTDEVGRITKIKIEQMKFSPHSREAFLDGINALKSSMRKKASESITTLEGLTRHLDDLRNQDEDNS